MSYNELALISFSFSGNPLVAILAQAAILLKSLFWLQLVCHFGSSLENCVGSPSESKWYGIRKPRKPAAKAQRAGAEHPRT